jgi:hypothetical protein
MRQDFDGLSSELNLVYRGGGIGPGAAVHRVDVRLRDAGLAKGRCSLFGIGSAVAGRAAELIGPEDVHIGPGNVGGGKSVEDFKSAAGGERDRGIPALGDGCVNSFGESANEGGANCVWGGVRLRMGCPCV